MPIDKIPILVRNRGFIIPGSNANPMQSTIPNRSLNRVAITGAVAIAIYTNILHPMDKSIIGVYLLYSCNVSYPHIRMHNIAHFVSRKRFLYGMIISVQSVPA